MTPIEIDHKKRWKYAKPEIERRFLLAQRPKKLEDYPFKTIEDKYITGTKIRLRKTCQGDQFQYKLTKKLPLPAATAPLEWASTIYLSQDEYEVFSMLPGSTIKKRRYYTTLASGKALGIDEIALPNEIIWIAEVEFAENEPLAVVLPFSGVREITNDKAYAGNELAKLYAGGA